MGGTIPWVGLLGCTKRRESEPGTSIHCPFLYGLGVASCFKFLLSSEPRP